jgi:hypothetical protein
LDDLLVGREQGKQKKAHRDYKTALLRGCFLWMVYMSVKLVFLTQQFYNDYFHCPEILHKEDRPHIQVQVKIDGFLFCIPLRSNINHLHVIWTDKANNCGLDLSKTIVITNSSEYIDVTRKPVIRQQEFDSLRGKEHLIKTSLIKYIAKYKLAKSNIHISRNRILIQYSALQYFEEYI